MSKIKRAIDELWMPSHLRRKPSQPPTCKRFMGHYPCSNCCSSATCSCQCANCLDPNVVPCCWQVVIAGIVDGSGTDDCNDCDTLNKTYFLSDSEQPGTSFGTSVTANDCYWEEEAVCGDCIPSRIILEVVFESPNYLIRVTMGGNVWEKDYGATKPDCCNISSVSIPHVTSSGDCDSSSSTCTITARTDIQTCDTAACLGDCGDCDNPPEELAVDLGAFGLSNDACDACVDITGVFVLAQFSACVWQFCADDWCTANQCLNSNPGTSDYALHIRATLTEAAGELSWVVVVQLNGGFTCASGSQFGGLKWVYRSTAQVVATDPTCLSADGTVDLALGFGTDITGCADLGKTPLCGNADSVTDPIQIFDANA